MGGRERSLDGGWLATVLRHEAFNGYALQLAETGVGSGEIAGNGPSSILVSVFARQARSRRLRLRPFARPAHRTLYSGRRAIH